jgi:type I restriction enzyme, S subunit
MKRYEKYKDSGVEGIDGIPEGWEVKKLKYSVTVNPPKENIEKFSSELVVCTCSGGCRADHNLLKSWLI